MVQAVGSQMRTVKARLLVAECGQNASEPKKQNEHVNREGEAWRSDSERKFDPGDQSIIDVLRWQGSGYIWVSRTHLPATRDAGEQDQAISRVCKGC